jgi:hypothetical protein
MRALRTLTIPPVRASTRRRPTTQKPGPRQFRLATARPADAPESAALSSGDWRNSRGVHWAAEGSCQSQHLPGPPRASLVATRHASSKRPTPRPRTLPPRSYGRQPTQLVESARLNEKRKRPRVVRRTAQAVVSCPCVRQLLRAEIRHEGRAGSEDGLQEFGSPRGWPRWVATGSRNAQFAGAFETVVAPRPGRGFPCRVRRGGLDRPPGHVASESTRRHKRVARSDHDECTSRRRPEIRAKRVRAQRRPG